MRNLHAYVHKMCCQTIKGELQERRLKFVEGGAVARTTEADTGVEAFGLLSERHNALAERLWQIFQRLRLRPPRHFALGTM